MSVTFGPNEVTLVGHYGDDKTHALSAWTSSNRELTESKRERMGSFLKMLADAGHHTPFEKSLLHFIVTVDTASHIHLLKHRIGMSVNGESARYKELKGDRCYMPSDWPETQQDQYKAIVEICYYNYHETLESLEGSLGRKRAKESARFLLPYGNQLTLDVTFNFRSFMHFQGLRNKPDAQEEIQWVAQEMLRQVGNTGKFTNSLAGFGY